ncbi:MAG TPA: vWA domain-containing protein [Spirochaetota bacterium]|nr:vWA domain-containing protein [Spirochaetota bacterium]HPJ34008.1 vWA domain-containing protein [Spirochaetota bacterium]
MKQILSLIILTMAITVAGTLHAGPGLGGGEKIQIALLLDTSSSMDGLIDQAKSKLWKIVNELAAAEKDGKTPDLEVALFEYGKSTIPEGESYMRMIIPFTGDLDRISAELFALTTNGGDEYCGKVIDSATKNLAWEKSSGSLKLIFIAGNEPFNQGETSYIEAGRKAKAKKIIINTIFCGDNETGISTYWKDGADITGGKYINIDHNRKVMTIVAPQDAEITRLNIELNKTYIAYGRKGNEKKMEQELQDTNARSISGGTATERAISKASTQYRNSSWDIVDAVKDREVDLKEMDDEDLPEEMKGMDRGEREKYVKQVSKRREDIRKRINKLNIERRAYIEKTEKKQGGEDTLDSAIIKTVRKQAAEKNFKFR